MFLFYFILFYLFYFILFYCGADSPSDGLLMHLLFTLYMIKYACVHMYALLVNITHKYYFKRILTLRITILTQYEK